MKDNRINYDLERKLRRYAIGNLMKYIVIGQGIVFALMYIWPTLGYRLYSLISLTRAGLMRGQIWRLVTFVFTPPSSSPIFILFALYFYYMIGLGLENQWGKVKFNLYYGVGMLGSIIAALITGYADNTFLNLSLFFAYAALYPDECKRVADLGVDMLAAGIGNIHGKYPANWKGLSFETLAAVKEKVGDMPLVLHGGTGIPEDMIKKAISLGVAKINVNTECQLAFADATRKYIEAGKDLEGKGFDPRKLLAPGAEAIKATVKTKMELFGSVGKAD